MKEEILCFVMMPIKSGSEREFWLDILNSIIRPAVLATGHNVSIERVDEVPGTGNWLERIVKYTANADIVIADLTGLNPNVIWELGLRHGSNQRGTIMITHNFKEFKERFSDLLSYDVHTYKEDGSDLYEFKRKIKFSFDKILGDQNHVDSPFYNFINHKESRTNQLDVKILLEDENLEVTRYDHLEILEFDEAKPGASLEKHLEENSIPEDDFDDYVSVDEVKAYNLHIIENAERHLAVKLNSWLERRRISLATRFGIEVENNSNVPIESVKLELIASDNLSFSDDKPEHVKGFTLSKKPKTKAEAKAEAQIEGFTKFAGLLNKPFSFSPSGEMLTIRNMNLANRLHKGIWTYKDNSSRAWGETLEIMQHDYENRWDKLYVIPTNEFVEGHIRVEIRAKGVRGVFVKDIPVRIKGSSVT